MNNSGSVQVERKSNTLLLILGWISVVISLIRLPFLFGVFGVVMGILATKNGSRAGLSLIVASILLMTVGMIFGGVFYNFLVRLV